MLNVLGSVLAGLIAVIATFGTDPGFGALPPAFVAVPAVLVVTYLRIVELLKQRSYRVSGWQATVSSSEQNGRRH